jgi:hypothetical protein
MDLEMISPTNVLFGGVFMLEHDGGYYTSMIGTWSSAGGTIP